MPACSSKVFIEVRERSDSLIWRVQRNVDIAEERGGIMKVVAFAIAAVMMHRRHDWNTTAYAFRHRALQRGLPWKRRGRHDGFSMTSSQRSKAENLMPHTSRWQIPIELASPMYVCLILLSFFSRFFFLFSRFF